MTYDARFGRDGGPPSPTSPHEGEGGVWFVGSVQDAEVEARAMLGSRIGCGTAVSMVRNECAHYVGTYPSYPSIMQTSASLASTRRAMAAR